QGVRQRPEHRAARVALLALLQPDVVVDAHPGEGGELLPPQARRAPQAHADGQPHVLRPHPGPAGPQERGQRCRAHATMVARTARSWVALSLLPTRGPGTARPERRARTARSWWHADLDPCA